MTSYYFLLPITIGLLVAGYLIRLLWLYSVNKTVDRRLKSGGHGFKADKISSRAQPNCPYYEFVELLPEMVYECDLKGNIVYVNQATYKRLGVDKEDLLHQPNIFDFLHPDDSGKVREKIEQIEKGDKSTGSEYRVFSRQGKLISVLAYTLPVIEKGKIKGLRGLLLDISRRKQDEETILILRDVMSHIDMGINVFRFDELSEEFKLEMVNEASGHLLRFAVEKNIGKNLPELSPLFVQHQLDNLFFKVIQTGVPAELDDFKYAPDAAGKDKTYSFKIFPLPQNRVAVLIQDITGPKSMEGPLKMNQFGIENAADIILWLDENAHLTYANQTASQRYGFPEQQLKGMHYSEIDSRVTKMQWFELTQILDNKQSLTLESVNKAGSGEVFPVEVSLNQYIYGGRKHYFVIIKDISERKRNDELEQKIQIARQSAALKQQFLANMSHEIRTPMTGIMGMTSLLLRTSLSMAQLEYVKNIKVSSENLLNIINDVLDLSKIEAGKMELRPNSIAFSDFVAEVKEVFQHDAEKKGLAFYFSIDHMIPESVIVDDTRLKQLLNNLLSNAFKFTEEGEVSIHFQLLERRNDDLLISCDVKDTGVGISERNQKQIFEKFTQIDSSFVRPFEGSGLGLAICRELAQLMGGEISVESEPGTGSIFSFTFKASFDDSNSSMPEELGYQELRNMNLNVLHVEDKLLNQKVVGFILINAGCHVDFLKNGQEAVERFTPGKYDVILMDIQMPVMDGVTAFKELKRLYGDKLCPIIGLSANAMEGDVERFMEIGFDDYIVKPFVPQTLYDKLLKWVGKNSQTISKAKPSGN